MGAGNRGGVTPFGCNKCASIFKRLTQKFRHAFCTLFACKAELTLSQSFKHGSLHNLHSRNICVGNRGEKTPYGCDNRARNRGEINHPWWRGEVTPFGCNKCASIFKRLTQKFRHAFCTLFACKAELTLSQSFKHGRSHNLHSRNMGAGNRGEKTPFGCDNRARNRGEIKPLLGFEVVSFYQFKKLKKSDLSSICKELLVFGQQHRIRGLILLSVEGINATVSGRPEDIRCYLNYIESITGITDCLYKRFWAKSWGFKRLKVKVKKVIITMERSRKNRSLSFLKQKYLKLYHCIVKGAYPFKRIGSLLFLWGRKEEDISSFALSPSQVESMLKDPDLAVLDIRNYYEVELGRFKGAKVFDAMKEFGEFPEKLRSTALNKEQKTLIYCTGGIRCEKALKEMRRQGFKEVYLLKGGILHYLKEFPYSHFEGECFVFDQRVAVDQKGKPSQKYSLCPHCGQPADQERQCMHCNKTVRICNRCLGQNQKHLMTCSKNCAHHVQSSVTS